MGCWDSRPRFIGRGLLFLKRVFWEMVLRAPVGWVDVVGELGVAQARYTPGVASFGDLYWWPDRRTWQVDVDDPIGRRFSLGL